jgi:hypothetical protein
LNPQLYNYIHTYLNEGFTKEDLISHLLQTGYDLNSINEVFNYIEGHKSQIEQNEKQGLQVVDPSNKSEEQHQLKEESRKDDDLQIDESILSSIDEEDANINTEKEEKKKLSFHLNFHMIMNIVIGLIFVLFLVFLYVDYHFLS